MRVFSLNYDLCFEKAKPTDYEYPLELGFDEGREWKWEKFEAHESPDVGIYLYKLHGSIDWKRDSKNTLKTLDNISSEPDLIFGTIDKLQSVDPYLFYIYEFRKFTLACRLIIVVGYSFSDEYINRLLRQALDKNLDRKLLCVGPSDKPAIRKAEICSALGLEIDSQVELITTGAKDYLDNHLTIEKIKKIINKEDEEIFV